MKSLTIIGKRWFQRSYGNTYFSGFALIDGKPCGVSIDKAYGYGNHYEHEVFDAVERAGLLPAPREHYERTGGAECPWMYCEKHGIAYQAIVSDVPREKDL